jgi:hypothetical protein
MTTKIKQSKQPFPVKLKFKQHGTVLINNSYIAFRTSRVVAIEIECETKNLKVGSCHTNENGKQIDEIWLDTGKCNETTIVTFPEFPGWSVYLLSSEAERTAQIVLTKGHWADWRRT